MRLSWGSLVTADVGPPGSGLKAWLLLTVCSWVIHMTSLGLSFLVF